MAGDDPRPGEWDALRRRIIGLGEKSIHKSYYPQLQQRLNELQRFKALLDGSSEGIFLIRLSDARLVDVNESACHQLRYTCAELLELVFFDLLPLEHVPTLRNLWESLQSSPQGHSMSTEFVRSDRTRFPVEVSLRLAAFGLEHFAVVVARDIGERLRMEKELQRAQNLESLGILAGGIAHDFNNCLTAVVNQISLAKMRLHHPEEAQEKLLCAENACLQAKGLTQQLLTFAKGGEPISRTISIGGLITDAVRLVFAGTNIKPVLSVPEDLWLVNVDPSQISQVLNNVLINAVQAMPDGGIVRISARNVPADAKDACLNSMGDHLCLSIEDSGPGIPKEHLSRIFDPYFTTKSLGSGLGLATSHSIILKHHGSIDVSSQEGLGTNFFIRLPVVDKIPDQRESAAVVREEEHLAAAVLFMDDDQIIRDSMEEILQDLGCSVTLVRDGREALDALRKALLGNRSFAVAILDLTIPGGMGGAEVVRELKALDPRIKAVVSSGYGMAPAMARHEEFGFDAVLSKPYTVAELHQVIQRLLGEITAGDSGKSVLENVPLLSTEC